MYMYVDKCSYICTCTCTGERVCVCISCTFIYIYILYMYMYICTWAYIRSVCNNNRESQLPGPQACTLHACTCTHVSAFTSSDHLVTELLFFLSCTCTLYVNVHVQCTAYIHVHYVYIYCTCIQGRVIKDMVIGYWNVECIDVSTCTLYMYVFMYMYMYMYMYMVCMYKEDTHRCTHVQ